METTLEHIVVPFHEQPASCTVWKGIASRFGGFWRYPDVKDYCFLVNPYFPTPGMIDELRGMFKILLTEYPSGMRYNAQFAADMFGVPPRQIIPGNGASELIKLFMEDVKGNVGFVYPTFEEYPNRIAENRRLVFNPQNDGFRYTAGDLMKFFSNKKISCICLVNPDNPSGNLLTVKEVEDLSLWASRQSIKILIDESFADFEDRDNRETLINSELLAEHTNLYVIKSIGKSFGVPGCRLGVLASGDEEFIAFAKKKVSIWNINPFGEVFMEIMPRYRSEYEKGCDSIAAERNRFFAELGKIGFLKVFPSQANYFLARVKSPFDATSLTNLLWDKYKILLKDCSNKKGFPDSSYVRITVRDQEDNDMFMQALRSLV